MSLPKISVPTYELQIPSIKKNIKYRPFLVKEEKVLIIAMESDDTKQIAEAVKTVISNCIITKGFKVENLATFDIEYLFLNIRGKSVGESVDVLITCPDDGTTRMKYPSMQEFIKNNFGSNSIISVDDTFDMIVSCIEQIYSEEESWASSDSTKKELNEFVEQLTTNQFKEIEKFFDTMPKLSHTIKVKNPNTGVESEVVLEGLTSFFA